MPSTGLSPLRNKDFAAFVVSRTGHLPKNKTNKDGALKAEAVACMNLPVIISTPPPSPPRLAAKEHDDEEGSDSDSDCSVDPAEALLADFD